MIRLQQRSTLFPYTTLFRSCNRFSETPKELLHVTEWPHDGTSKPPLRDAAKTYRIITDLLSQLQQYGHKTAARRSEEHTSELQSRRDLVCRLLLEKKKFICF